MTLDNARVLRGTAQREARARAAGAVDAFAATHNGLAGLMGELKRRRPDPLAMLDALYQ